MSRLISALILIAFITIINSCNDWVVITENHFPVSESEMLRNPIMIGTLLEYAIYDTSKIEFVKSIVCDSLQEKKDYTFFKVEAIINDSSYHFFYFQEREYHESDYIGILYIDIDNLDSISMYSKEYKFHIKEFEKIVEQITYHEKCSISEIFKYRKIGSYYIPRIYFIVEFNSMSCSDGFIEKVIKVNSRINSLLSTYFKEKFPTEEILISPEMEFVLKQ